MKNLNILLLGSVFAISKVSGCVHECWSEKLGYPCCYPTNDEVLEVDKYGEWGMEDGERCGIYVYDPRENCLPVFGNYDDCASTYCDDVISVDEEGTIWGFDTENKKSCIINPNESSCKTKINDTCWSALLGYKCCKTTFAPLYKDENGVWSIENNEWCGVERCSDCSNVEEIDKYGNIWGTNKSSNKKCIMDKHDEKCSTQLEKSCKSAKKGYPCCKNTEKVIYEDSFGSWGVENGQWCGFN